MNTNLSYYSADGGSDNVLERTLLFRILIENQPKMLSLVLYNVRARAYYANPQIVVYEFLAMGNNEILNGVYGSDITLRLSNYQIYNNIDFSVSLCNNVYNEINIRGKKCDYAELFESINEVRNKIQNMISKFCMMPQAEYQGYYFVNGVCNYGIPINSLTRNQLCQDCYSFINNHDKYKIQNENDIPEILHKVIDHFMQLKNKDIRRFLFLYFHMCYMASLFTPLDQSMILVIDSHSRVREDLIQFMFGDCQQNCCEYIGAGTDDKNLNGLYAATKDLPFVLDVYDGTTIHKYEAFMDKALPRNDGTMSPFYVGMQAIPVAFSSQPVFCEEMMHLSIDSHDLSDHILPMKHDFHFEQYFDAICIEYNKVYNNSYPISETASQGYNLSYRINRQHVNINQEPTVYAVFRTLNAFLQQIYRNNDSESHDLSTMGKDLFDEDIDTFLARFMPSLRLDTSFHRDHFYEAVGKLVNIGDISVFDPERTRLDDCASRDVYESQACLFHSKDSWLLNEPAIRLLAKTIPENCSATRLLHLLDTRKVLTSHRINQKSYQVRRRIYFREGDYIDAEVYEVYPKDGLIPDDEEHYSWDIAKDGLHFHLGKNAASGADMYWDFDSENNINQHMLITGGSGAGKSCFLDDLVSQAKKLNITTVVFHQQGALPYSERELVLDIKKDKLGLCCFDKDDDDHHKVAERLASALHLTTNQKERISEAYERYLDQKTGGSEDSELPEGDPSVHDFIDILTKKKQLFKEVTPTIRQKLSNFDEMNAASAKIINWADYEGKRVILDFRGAPNEDWYKYNAELYLQDLFRYRQTCLPEKGAPAPMIIVSDEFQNMNTKKGAALERILREGRKYGIALWLASQLVESDTGSKLKGITDQCSMKVYFMAGTERAKKIARLLSISTSEKTKMQAQICSLKKREFVFQLNGNKPYKCIANEVKKLNDE